MKKLLKYLLLQIFIVAPTLTVVACGTSQQIADQDVLNSALGRMKKHTFKMTELNLAKLPTSDESYSGLDSTAKEKITAHYSKLVSSDSLEWNYPSVAVTIDGSEDIKFEVKYGADVEAKIILNVNLKYKDLTDSAKVVIKIDNDDVNQQVKIEAIAKFLQDKISKKNDISFETLPKDNLKSNDPGVDSERAKIEGALKNAFFKIKDGDSPWIDVDNVTLSVESDTEPASTIYSLTNSSSDKISGQLTNLKLNLLYDGTSFHKYLEISSLNISQNIDKAINQIKKILSEATGGINFDKNDLNGNKLPAEGELLTKYDSAETFQKKVKEKLFNKTAIIYPQNKMNNSWDVDKIIIKSPEQSIFVKEDDHYGYFIINISFNFQGKEGEDVANLKLVLSDI